MIHAAAEDALTQIPTHYQVPRGDRQMLVQPPLEESPALIAENQWSLNESSVSFAGHSLQHWRIQAREELLQQFGYSGQELEDRLHQPWIMTGHQPELTHPGVFLKNLLTSRLAEDVGGFGLNLTVDTDTIKSRSVTVPVREGGTLKTARVSVDRWPIGTPWEDAGVVDRDFFNTFPDRVMAKMASLEKPSALPLFWRELMEAVNNSGDLVNGLIAGRKALENNLGVENQEIRLSELARTSMFRQFIAGIILQADSFCEHYNEALSSYRQVYGIKKSTRPMPDLECHAGEWELPLWIWTAEQPQRHGLFVRRHPEGLQLTDHAGWQVVLPHTCLDSPETVAEHLRSLCRSGCRIRSRALMTTFYVRLFLADWFIHGIGGAKYDEVTDELIRRQLKLSPPRFQVATGTLYLPLADRDGLLSGTDEVHDLKLQLRRARQNPECVLSEARREEAQELLEQKQKLIEEHHAARTRGLSRSERRERTPVNKARHDQFKEIRQRFLELAQPQIERLELELDRARERRRQQVVAGNREYPYCLYPLETLSDLQQMIAKSSSVH